MRKNTLISLLTVLALVVALLYPLPLHCCQTLSHAGRLVGDAEVEHCLMHGKAEPEAPPACGNCRGDGHASQGAKSQSVPGERSSHSGIGIDMVDGAACGCLVVTHAAIDVAVLSPAGLQFHAPVVAAVPVQLLLLLPRLAGEPVFKIGSSPPFMADKSHYTYLHTSSFLI